MESVPTKRCTACQVVLPLDQFTINRAVPGWQGWEWGMYVNDALAAIDALRGES